MQDKIKKLLAWMLTAAMLVGMIPSTILADNTSNVFTVPREIVQRVATVEGKIENVKQAELSVDKTSLKISGDSLYKIAVNAPVDEAISLNSTDITVKDQYNNNAPVQLEGNLFYTTAGADENGVYSELTKVDYLKLAVIPEETIVLEAYDVEHNKLSGGTFFLGTSIQDEVLANIHIDAIKIVTKPDNELVSAEKISNSSFTYSQKGVPGADIFNLEDITGVSEFYYGDITAASTELQKCSQVKIQKMGEEYRLCPLDSNGDVVETNVYMVYDHLYQFEITLKEMVKEHGEDNGDVFFWKGTTFKYPRAATEDEAAQGINPADPVDIEAEYSTPAEKYLEAAHVDEGATAVRDVKITLTGRVGDTFTPDEANQLMIYAKSQTLEWNMNWYYVHKSNASDNGNRGDNYLFNDFLKLNSFTDKVNYFEIVEENGTVGIKVVFPGSNRSSMLIDTNLIIARDSVARYALRELLTTEDAMKNPIGHIQFRLPNNVMVKDDATGNIYSSSLTLDSVSTSIKYEEKELDKSSIGEDGENSIKVREDDPETEELENQETTSFGFTAFSASEDSDKDGLPDAFDSNKVIITVTYKVSGTLTNIKNPEDTVTYTSQEITQTLTSAQLRQAYYDCPNQSGYDVALDITASAKTAIQNQSQITVTKVWEDEYNRYGSRPESVTVTLQRSVDGQNWEDVTVTDDNGNTKLREVVITGDSRKSIWTEQVSNIDTFIPDGDDKAIPYEFRIKTENYTAVEGFEYEEPVINGTTVTNTLKLETDVTIRKTWNGNTADSGNISYISYALYQDGKYYAYRTISAANDWTTTFENLPIYRDRTFGSTEIQRHEYTFYEIDGNGKRIADGEAAEFNGVYYYASIDTHLDENGVEMDNCIIEKPVKTEAAPGANEKVAVGDEITYKISYKNYKEKTASVTITDPLDAGVDFVSATDNGFYDASTRKVIWTLTDVEAGTGGEVTFTVKVNEGARPAEGDSYTIKNQAGVKIGNDYEIKTDIIENPVDPSDHGQGSIIVQKYVKQDNEYLALDYTFYTSLFADKELTNRVTAVKELKVSGSYTTSVVFDELEYGTYYLAETDEAGNPITGDDIIKATEIINSELILTKTNPIGKGTIINHVAGLSEDFYKGGRITIHKEVLINGESGKVSDTFFFVLYVDEEMTMPYDLGVIELTLDEESKGSVTFEQIPYGNYYLAETDALGNPVDTSYEYVSVIDHVSGTINETNREIAFHVTNAKEVETETEEETEIETEVETETVTEKDDSVDTGDHTPVMTHLMMLVASVLVLLGLLFRKISRNYW